MANRVTQEPREVVIQPTDAKARSTQEAREVLIKPTDSKARMTQGTREVLIGSTDATARYRAGDYSVEITAERHNSPGACYHLRKKGTVMSLIFCDSFDHYTTPLQKWDAQLVSFSGPQIITAAARTGARGLNNQRISWVRKNLGGNYAAVIAGFGFNLPDNTIPSSAPICCFWDSGNVQVDLRMNSAGNLFFTRNGTVMGTASAWNIRLGTFYYLEVKVTVASGTNGSAEVRLNGGAQVHMVSGVNTQATTNAYTNQFSLGSGGAGIGGYADGPGPYFDDVYILNTSGASNNNYLGDVAVQMNVPSGDGSGLQWTPTGGGTHYSQVNEIPPNDDTSYVSDGTVGDTDYYTFPSILSMTGTVYGVAVNLRARKDDAGTRSIRAALKSPASTGTAADNGSDFSQNTTYTGFQAIFETDPNTAAAWTVSAVNAAEFGVKVTA